MNYEILGQVLKNARSNAKFTQQEIAAKIGVTFQNVSSWERGKSKIDIDTLAKLCGIYNINFVTVLEHATDMQNSSVKNDSQIISEDEIQLIKKYRLLDQRGQQTVLDTLNREYSYIAKEGIDLAAIAVDAINTIDMLQSDLPINQYSAVNKK
jgi:transcriptional regulator with XRE-family HTH domain